MKNAQNDYENLLSAPKNIATTTTTIPGAPTTTTTTTTTTTETIPVPSSSPVRSFSGNNENAHNDATAANAATNTRKMTDEYNTENNKDSSSSSNSINNNGSLIAEAAKILLKNGLNGTSAAAAALLTAATSFQLPTIPVSSISSTSPILPGSVIDGVNVGTQLIPPPPAHVASSPKVSSKMSSAVAVGHLSQRNNGLPNPSSNFKATAKDMCLTSNSGEGFLSKAISMSASGVDAGVLDYTVSTASNGTQKASTGVSHSSGIGGGRLQFFKDGKFILELARSKDGERGGWVSVPRKHFRQPSATTSTVTPASTANTCIYPKIESSTSLSFSDDNSSIQSSPWQRDHCWKQTTPKRNISKEMSVFYKTPRNVIITKAGLRLAKRKRRRPYDELFNELNGLKLFECCEESERSPNENCQSTDHRHQNGSTIKTEDEDHSSTSSVATLVGDGECSNLENEGILAQKSMKSIKTELLSDDEHIDVVKSAKTFEESEPEGKVPTPTSEERKVKSETDDDMKLEVDKINTSEDGDETMSTTPDETTKNVIKTGISTDDDDKDEITENATKPSKPVQSKTKGVEDKRLNKKKRKERAKLNSIVQKLIDRMPAARVSNLSKMPLLNNSSNSNTQQNSNFLSNKVSPNSSSSSTSPSLVSASSASATATATTSRLVEYHHHQQHVSPRKRILREFEKVSLEDTAALCGGAGGKRSRAKSNANTSLSTNYRNARSPNNRVHSNACAVVPGNAATLSMGSSSSISIPSSNGESFQNVNSTTPTSVKYAKSSTSSSAPSTRLYSSYSIHSLLGDQSNNSSGNGSTSSFTSKSTEQSSTYQHQHNHNQHQHQQQNQHQQQQNQEHSFHARKSVSPKSPETGGGGKSPSSNNVNKKRSPPYSSPKHESVLRSPSVNNSVDYSSRATPPEFNSTSKHRYGASSGLTDQSVSNAHQFHRHSQQSVLYSPYMMSPKYVPGSSSTPMGISSPRHSTTAAATSTTITTSNTNTQQNIPNSYGSHSASTSSLSHQREQSQSPSRSMADFSRETTPRTVPKKTASIRRQFASPTALSSNNSSSNTNCPSPSERANEECASDNKTSNSSIPPTSTAASYQQLLQQSSTLSSPLHAAYYMYPPAPPLQFGNSSATGGNNVPPTSAYIPSYYHSYLSALNITKHYYMGAGASQSAAAAAAARLSSPFHPMSIPYNGVSAAAVAAAAAAAAATAAFSGQPHMGHHPMLASPSAATAAALYGVGGGGSGFGLSLSAAPPPTQTYKSTDSNLAITQNADLSPETTMSSATISTASTHPTQFSSNRDEHSSDVPLNLSKH